MTVCQRLSMILENKGLQKWKLETNVVYKTWSSKFIFFNEKKIRKIRMVFDI